VTTEGNDEENRIVGVGVTVEPESRGGSDREIEGSGREIVGSGVEVGMTVEPESSGGSDREIEGSGREIDGSGVLVGSRGGNDKVIEGGGSDRESEGSGREIVGLGPGVVVGISVEPESRGGNDREIDGDGNDMVTAGSGSRIGFNDVTVGSGGLLVLYPSSRLKAKPLARAAKRREETRALENMISKTKKSREA
jgi:hypothetical protein